MVPSRAVATSPIATGSNLASFDHTRELSIWRRKPLGKQSRPLEQELELARRPWVSRPDDDPKSLRRFSSLQNALFACFGVQGPLHAGLSCNAAAAWQAAFCLVGQEVGAKKLADKTTPAAGEQKAQLQMNRWH